MIHLLPHRPLTVVALPLATMRRPAQEYWLTPLATQSNPRYTVMEKRSKQDIRWYSLVSWAVKSIAADGGLAMEREITLASCRGTVLHLPCQNLIAECGGRVRRTPKTPSRAHHSRQEVPSTLRWLVRGSSRWLIPEEEKRSTRLYGRD
jgi:hypothetical protein